ncbi:MAG: cobalamin-binding protein [Gemmatimonadetes bacterium]|nr:MAG: cobalamin-binding protein [Gemmatimonadota bacterium]
MRIVSLACSNTEIVCALGCADLLVGVDDHSDHPPDVVARLPRVGPDLDIDVERVAALRPDLVLATLTVPGHEAVVERLEAAGLPYVAPEPTSLADVYRDIDTIAGLLGVPERGRALVAEMRSRFDAARRRSRGRAQPSVLVQWWPKPVIAPGARSWVNDVLEAVGGRNPFATDEVKSRPIPDDEVVAADPDAIVISWCGVDPAKYRPDVVLEKPAFGPMRAVRGRQVHCVPEAFLGRPGPRLVDGLDALERIVEGLGLEGESAGVEA